MLDDLAVTLLVQLMSLLFLHSFKMTVNSVNIAGCCKYFMTLLTMLFEKYVENQMT